MLMQLDDHLPAVQAEQQLGLHGVLVASSGRHLKQHEHATWLKELQRQARGGRQEKPIKASTEDMRKLGIEAVHHTDKKAAW